MNRFYQLAFLCPCFLFLGVYYPSANPERGPALLPSSGSNLLSCLSEEEQALVDSAHVVFLERMAAFYPDSMAHPFQTFLRQYEAIEVDRYFFELDSAQYVYFKTQLPWVTYEEPEPELEFDIIPPQPALEEMERTKQKLSRMQYPEETLHLPYDSALKECLYEGPVGGDLPFYFRIFREIGLHPSRSRGALWYANYLTEEMYAQPAVQRLIVVEVFLQACMNWGVE